MNGKIIECCPVSAGFYAEWKYVNDVNFYWNFVTDLILSLSIFVQHIDPLIFLK